MSGDNVVAFATSTPTSQTVATKRFFEFDLDPERCCIVEQHQRVFEQLKQLGFKHVSVKSIKGNCPYLIARVMGFKGDRDLVECDDEESLKQFGNEFTAFVKRRTDEFTRNDDVEDVNLTFYVDQKRLSLEVGWYMDKECYWNYRLDKRKRRWIPKRKWRG